MLLEVCDADLQLKQEPKAGCIVVQSVPPLASSRQCPRPGGELFQTLCFALQPAAQHGCAGDSGHCNAETCSSRLGSARALVVLVAGLHHGCLLVSPHFWCASFLWAGSRSARLTREPRCTQELQNGLAEAGSRAE